jgi:hypothetical protein
MKEQAFSAEDHVNRSAAYSLKRIRNVGGFDIPT